MVDYERTNGGDYDPYADKKAVDEATYKILKAIREVGWVTNTETVQAGTVFIIDFSLSPEEPNIMQQAQGGIFGSSILYDIRRESITRAILRLGYMDLEGYVDKLHAGAEFEVEVDKLNPPGDDMRVNLGDFDQGIKHINLYTVKDIDGFVRFLREVVDLRGTFENPEAED